MKYRNNRGLWADGNSFPIGRFTRGFSRPDAPPLPGVYGRQDRQF